MGRACSCRSSDPAASRSERLSDYPAVMRLEQHLRSPAVRLFLTAMSILFVELLLIRWIPANVIYVGFFRNFLLMASFLGIGLGILWGRDPGRIPISPFGPLLLSWCC